MKKIQQKIFEDMYTVKININLSPDVSAGSDPWTDNVLSTIWACGAHETEIFHDLQGTRTEGFYGHVCLKTLYTCF